MQLKRPEIDRLRTAQDPADVIQEFFDESTNADKVPLDSFCTMGGAPDPEDTPDIEVVDAKVTGNECTGELTADFNEVVYGGGCPDMPTVRRRQGDLCFKICLASGTVTFG